MVHSKFEFYKPEMLQYNNEVRLRITWLYFQCQYFPSLLFFDFDFFYEIKLKLRIGIGMNNLENGRSVYQVFNKNMFVYAYIYFIFLDLCLYVWLCI